MRIQERDKKILEYIYTFQCLNSNQNAKLFFNKSLKLTQRRLRILCKAGYLQKVPIPSIKPGKSPYLYYLGNESASLLNVPVSKPRFTLQLTHQQKNTDIMIEIILSFKSANIQCEVLPEHLIRISKEENILIPDGSFVLIKKNKHALFFLENCSGTEIIKSPSLNKDIEAKIINYVEMFKNNNIQFYETYFGCSFNRFRMLFIANNAQRLSAISNIVKDNDSSGFIWLTTLSQFMKHGVDGNIWYVPVHDKINLSII